MKYKIQLLFSYGWDDESDEPCFYDSETEAENELKEHLDQFDLVPLEDRMKRQDYRIVSAPEAESVQQLRDEGWGVVLIPPEQMLEQAGKILNREQIKLIEDLLGDESVRTIDWLYEKPPQRRDVS